MLGIWMRGIVLSYSTYLLKVPVTHPDECRKEQEAVGIHTKNRVGLKIRASQPSLRTF